MGKIDYKQLELDWHQAVIEYEFQGMKIPPHNHEAIVNWICKGWLPGDFLQGLLACDFRKMMDHADDINMWHMPVIYAFFYNHAPAPCWGSKDNIKTWIKDRRMDKESSHA